MNYLQVMAKIFKATEREFRENRGRVDGYRLMSDAAMADFGAGVGAASGVHAGVASGVHAGGVQAGGVQAGGRLNFDIRRLDAGQSSSLYHFHRAAEELFMIVSGAATLRTPEGQQVLEAGDVAWFESGEAGAHALYNHNDVPCVYLDIRTFSGCDVAEYPDTGSLLVIPTMEKFRRSSAVGYFDEVEK